MALEAIASGEPFNFIIYDTISATPYSCQDSPALAETSFLLDNCAANTAATPTVKEAGAQEQNQSDIVVALESCDTLGTRSRSLTTTSVTQQQQQGRKKRKRKPRVCKNKEEAETQRMTHIAVERNRRKQMNEHLAILRSLMPETYAQRVLRSIVLYYLIDSNYLNFSIKLVSIFLFLFQGITKIMHVIAICQLHMLLWQHFYHFMILFSAKILKIE